MHGAIRYNTIFFQAIFHFPEKTGGKNLDFQSLMVIEFVHFPHWPIKKNGRRVSFIPWGLNLLYINLFINCL